ncbi:MAG: response regulator [Nitrospira sp.]|nr:response regulator [Nitrospira sp.]
MPEMDGFETTRLIREAERRRPSEDAAERSRIVAQPAEADPTAGGANADAEPPTPRHVPIIAMTANAMEADRLQCLASGMNDFVSKPIRREDLEQVLSRWLAADD